MNTMNDPVKLPDLPNNGTASQVYMNNTHPNQNGMSKSNSNVSNEAMNNNNRLPNINTNTNYNNRGGLANRNDQHNKTNNSNMSENSKKILRWHLWWDKQNSQIKIPMYGKPIKRDVDAKIGSLQNVTYRPGGGNVTVIDEKPSWNAAPRIDNKNVNYKRGGGNVSVIDERVEWNAQTRIDAKNETYRPGGGNVRILNQKVQWNTESKIDSLSNANYKPPPPSVKILDQPLDLTNVKSSIDTGFIFEEHWVPLDYEVKSPRNVSEFREHLDSVRKGVTSSRQYH